MREVLAKYEGQILEVVARVKEPYREHATRPDLTNCVLTNLKLSTVYAPQDARQDRIIELDHLWILRKQLIGAGIRPDRLQQGMYINFLARVYAYHRKGGKSKERDLYGYVDYGLLPLELVKDGIE